MKVITLFRTQEPETFARVFYRSTSILQPLIPIGEQPAPLGKNRLREIKGEICKEQKAQITQKAIKSDNGGKI